MECIIKIGDSKINLNVGLDILRKIGNVCTTYKCELDEVPSLKIIEEICPTDCDIVSINNYFLTIISNESYNLNSLRD